MTEQTQNYMELIGDFDTSKLTINITKENLALLMSQAEQNYLSSNNLEESSPQLRIDIFQQTISMLTLGGVR